MMFCKVTAVRPIIANVSRRSLSVLAEKKQENVVLHKEDVKVSKLSNGLTVASLENHSPVSKVGFIVNGGSRYESVDHLGVCHYIRSCAALSTKGSSGFAICRGIGDIGGSFEVTTTREHVIYSVQTLRDKLDQVVNYMTHAATSPSFRPWEIEECIPRMRIEVEMAKQPEIDVLERLHAAAYRDTLGNSLYCGVDKVGHIESEPLRDFVAKHYMAGSMTLVGLGVDHDHLVGYGENLSLPQGGAAPKEAAVYAGGEHSRNPTSDPLTRVIVATEGVAYGSKDYLAASILQHYLSGAPNIKRCTTMATSRLNHCIANVRVNVPFATSCININYSDSGLFGFYVVSQPEHMEPMLKELMSEFAATAKGVDGKCIDRAKNQLKASLLMAYENPDNVFEDIAMQAASTGSHVPITEVIKQIDSVTMQDVAELAKRLFNKKPTMAASGNLTNTPYLEKIRVQVPYFAKQKYMNIDFVSKDTEE